MADTQNTPSLIKKGLSYAFGDGSSTLVNVLVFTILLRYLSPSEFGYLSVGQALSSWVQPFLYMGANLVAVRLIAANPQQTPVIARRMIALRYIAATLIISITAATAINSSDSSLRAVLLAYSFLFVFYPIQPDFVAVGLNRPQVYSISRWIGAGCFLLAIVILTRFSIRAWMVPVVYAVSLLSSAVYGYTALWPAVSGQSIDLDLGLGVLLRGAMLVVTAQFLQMGQSCMSIILLKLWNVPVALVGDYNAVGRLTQAGNLPLTALVYSMAPTYVKQFANHDIAGVKALERRFRSCLLLIGIAGGVAIATVGPGVLGLVGGRQIASASRLAPLFGLGYLLVALQNSYTPAIVYAGAPHLYLATYALGGVSTLLAAIVLIPRFGTVGSASAELIGLVVILLASHSFHRRLVQRAQRASVVPVPAVVRL